MSTTQVLITILIMAGITLLTRALPFAVFPENRQTPEFVLYLGKVLPYAIIGMLVVYCFKSVSLFEMPFALPELIATLFVIAIHKWKHNLLISIGGGTVLYMVLVQLVF